MTDNPEIDPYAPPRAVLADPTTTGDYRDVSRTSTWSVSFLLWITLGLYAPYWLYTRIKALNAMPSVEPIPVSLPIAVCVLCLANVATSFADRFYPDMIGLRMLSLLAQFAFVIVNLVCIFRVRGRLNEDVGAQPGTSYWAGGLATFFLHVLYLNYKLNQRIDAERTAGESSSPRVVNGPVQA